MNERVSWGMVGGGEGAFIGAVHRAAAALDGLYSLDAGALSSDPACALKSGRTLGLAPDRNYESWRDMLQTEQHRQPNDRIELVSIVTPNHTHYEIARAFVDAGFHVIIDKPMTTTVDQAHQLVQAAAKSSVIGAVTYNYSGYPLVREAREMIRSGAIGAVRRVYVEYHQGWLATKLEQTGQKQAAWRTDPAHAGPAGAIGDIGTHAEHLLRYITGLEITSLCAETNTFVPGRKLDDDAAAMLKLSSGAHALLSVSQVCISEENNLSIRVHGELGSITWRQESPNELVFARLNEPKQTITRGSASLSAPARQASRLPTGHPEGFIEAFANIYRDVAAGVFDARSANKTPSTVLAYPTFEDGLQGVQFIDWMLKSAKMRTWLDRPHS